MKKLILLSAILSSFIVSAGELRPDAKQINIVNKYITKQSTIKECSFEAKYSIKGKISGAFLVIDASVDFNKSFSDWDDVYFLMTSGTGSKAIYAGGHLVNEKNQAVENNLEKTKIITALKNISYYETLATKEDIKHNVNFINLVNAGKDVRIRTFISSARAGRTINSMDIVYACDKSTPDCSINLISKSLNNNCN